MLIHIGYDLEIALTAPTPVVLLLDVHPERVPDLVVDNPLSVGGLDITCGLDFYGNRVQRVNAPAGVLKLSANAVIQDPGVRDEVVLDAQEVPVHELPDDCLHFLAGSRYCETDRLTALAWNQFGNVPPGWARVQAICDFVHHRLQFSYPNASPTRTALTAYEERVGVCRDFAHLAIALCRCMNIPARYVNGYLGDIGVPADPAPMDFSAWFEVYLDHRWMTFDARHNTPRAGRIVIARGRDAADVPMITTYGAHALTKFKVIAEEIDSQAIAMASRSRAA